MTRTRRKPLTAADARRMGGQPLDLLVRRTWLEYAVHRTGDSGTLDACYAALRDEGDPLTVRLTQTQADALAAACEDGGRTRTAGEIRDAVKAANEPPKPFDPVAHMEQLVADGILTPEELDDWRASRERKQEAGGLF